MDKLDVTTRLPRPLYLSQFVSLFICVPAHHIACVKPFQEHAQAKSAFLCTSNTNSGSSSLMAAHKGIWQPSCQTKRWRYAVLLTNVPLARVLPCALKEWHTLRERAPTPEATMFSFPKEFWSICKKRFALGSLSVHTQKWAYVSSFLPSTGTVLEQAITFFNSDNLPQWAPRNALNKHRSPECTPGLI